MSPPPGNQNGEAAAGDQHRSIPTPFLTKTYRLVDDPTIDDVISWNDDGSAFVVWNPTVFARDLLPKYFKHNNFSSFVRQLNTYGFRKVVPDRWEFANDYFRKGQRKLLLDIQRRKISAQLSPVKPIASSSNSGDEQVVSTNSSSPSVLVQTAGGKSTELIDENDRLRKENVQLAKEISEMKHLCNNIYSLVSNFQCNQPDNGLSPMDLMPMKRFAGGEEAEAARLFGVAIGVKRGRENPVKDEPRGCRNMDVDSDDGHGWFVAKYGDA